MKWLFKKNINKKDLRNYSILLLIIVLIGLIAYVMYEDNKIKSTRDKVMEINNTCNAVYDDVDGSEEKYIKLYEEEKDYFKKGMYASALVQVNTINGNYEGMAKYGALAVENYLKVQNGSLYAISENKYLSWAMFKVGKYSESLKLANQLTELLQSEESRILTYDEIMDTKALICTIYINIYSEFNLMDEAKIHYDILKELELPEAVKKGRGDKIAYSNMLYAMKIEEYELMKGYADECYKIAFENDKEFGTNFADRLKINSAIANIEVENYEEALNDIKIAESYLEKVEDSYSMVDIYEAYAKYYKAVNNISESYNNFIKAIELSKTIEGDIRLETLLKDFIEFCETNNININLNVYRDDYFNLTSKSEVDSELKKIVEEASKYNEELNHIKTSNFYKERDSLNKNNIMYISVILILIIMLIIFLYLLKIIDSDEKKLEELVNRDYLTKAYSRSYGYSLLDEAIKNERNVLLALIDIDNFKDINDIYGHLVGDKVLKEVAQAFIDEKNNIIIRFGGEEFLILYMDISKSEGIDRLNKIKYKLRENTIENNITITFSGGILGYDINLSIDENIEKIDKLLYKAKYNGKNCII